MKCPSNELIKPDKTLTIINLVLILIVHVVFTVHVHVVFTVHVHVVFTCTS